MWLRVQQTACIFVSIMSRWRVIVRNKLGRFKRKARAAKDKHSKNFIKSLNESRNREEQESINETNCSQVLVEGRRIVDIDYLVKQLKNGYSINL